MIVKNKSLSLNLAVKILLPNGFNYCFYRNVAQLWGNKFSLRANGMDIFADTCYLLDIKPDHSLIIMLYWKLIALWKHNITDICGVGPRRFFCGKLSVLIKKWLCRLLAPVALLPPALSNASFPCPDWWRKNFLAVDAIKFCRTEKFWWIKRKGWGTFTSMLSIIPSLFGDRQLEWVKHIFKLKYFLRKRLICSFINELL